MNFTHFVQSPGRVENGKDYLYRALRRGQAIISKDNVATLNLYFPVYHGTLNRPFDETELSVIIVQVNNRPEASYHGERQENATDGTNIVYSTGLQPSECDLRMLIKPNSLYDTKRFFGTEKDVVFIDLALRSKKSGLAVYNQQTTENANNIWTICVKGRDQFPASEDYKSEAVDAFYKKWEFLNPPYFDEPTFENSQ
ncbi:MAG: hypothetical protein M1820_003852 [Bogoriella megaspora]|nr:MAG: hypothetical protein M1820_003852 [Bogoriella megaspora]